jgi:hypothetical protein
MKPSSILLVVLLAGCNAQPLEYSKTGDMLSGPGMFSGPTGSFSISKERTAAAQPAALPSLDE